MIHWQVKFRSLRANTLYTVSIYDDRYQGDPVQLTGAADPFVTEEDNDLDFFKPVRTQTGYLNIVDTGYDNAGNVFDWQELMPADSQDRPVVLTDSNNNTLWQGYIEPQTFTAKLYENVQQRQFPVMCCLASLEGKQIPSTNQGIVTFARILDMIITWMGGDWDYVNFQGTYPMYWLQRKIDWSNFLNEESDGTYTSKYDALTLLEEICKFWGWTCRTHGKDIWLLCPDDDLDPDYVGIEPTDLYDYLDAGTVPSQYQEGEWATRNLDTDVYASDDNNIEYVPGIRKATIRANINKRDVVTSLPEDQIIKQWRNNQVTTVTVDTDKYNFYLKRDTGPEEYNFEDMHIDIDQYSTSTYSGYAWFQISDSYEGNIAYKHNYNWKLSLQVTGSLVGTPHESDYIVLIESIFPHSYSNGVLAISGNVQRGGTLTCRLRVGGQWWNGSTWQSSKTTFTMAVGDETNPTSGDGGKIIDTRALNGPYNMYEGYGAPISGSLGGKVRFEIVGFDATVQEDPDVVNISSLKIEFVRMLSYSDLDDERSENIYTDVSNKKFSDETSIDTIFASDQNNAFGLGIVMNYDGVYTKNVSYDYGDGAETMHPEQHLLNRIINRGKYLRRVERVQVRSNLMSITPYTKCTTAQMTGYPMSISHRWRDDITEAYIMQLQ